jgi:hypothetical protein
VIQFNRMWAMPSADTFSIPPIGEFVKKYLRDSKVSIDPFARNKRWATYTNDLNPDTAAECHRRAIVFLRWLRMKGIKADLIIFDPPYSPRQVKEVYESVGMMFGIADQWNSGRWTIERDLCYDILSPGGVFLSFGWNSQGLGKERHVETIEILLVPHGGAHNDTICMAERKIAHQLELA